MWSIIGDEIVETGNWSIYTYMYHATNIREVVVSDDGMRLASIHLNGMIRLIDSTDAKFREIRPLPPQPVRADSGVRAFQVAPDGRHLAMCSEDGFQIWRIGGPTAQFLSGGDRDSFAVDLVRFTDNRQFITAALYTPMTHAIFAPQKSMEIASGGRRLARGEGLLARDMIASHLLLMQNPSDRSGLSVWNLDRRFTEPVCTWRAAAEGREVSRTPSHFSSSADVENSCHIGYRLRRIHGRPFVAEKC